MAPTNDNGDNNNHASLWASISLCLLPVGVPLSCQARETCSPVQRSLLSPPSSQALTLCASFLGLLQRITTNLGGSQF